MGGHGFATNGPLLGLLAGGKAPGETLELPAAGGMVTIDAALRSIVPVTDWEIVFNGEVCVGCAVRTTTVSGAHSAPYGSERSALTDH